METKYYFCSITERNGGMEYTSNFIVRIEVPENSDLHEQDKILHDKLHSIWLEYRGGDADEDEYIFEDSSETSYWCDCSLIDYPDYREIRDTEFQNLRDFIAEL